MTTKANAVLKYTYGLDGQEPVPFDKLVALIEDLITRGCGVYRAMQADTVGLATIGAGDGFVAITPKNDINDIVHLPAIADVELGHVVQGVCVSTGCEIRVAVADDATVYLNNDKTTVHEAALAAGSLFKATKVAADRWILANYSTAGAFTAPTPD
jgi:hypothetical protein